MSDGGEYTVPIIGFVVIRCFSADMKSCTVDARPIEFPMQLCDAIGDAGRWKNNPSDRIIGLLPPIRGLCAKYATLPTTTEPDELLEYVIDRRFVE